MSSLWKLGISCTRCPLPSHQRWNCWFCKPLFCRIYIYIYKRCLSSFPLFFLFLSLSLSFSARENSRVREQQRVEERVSKGSKEKIEKQRVLNIPKGIRGMDRMTGERGRRAKSDEIGRFNLHQRRIAFRGSAGTRDVQCPGCINTTSHATWFIMPTACGKSL